MFFTLVKKPLYKFAKEKTYKTCDSFWNYCCWVPPPFSYIERKNTTKNDLQRPQTELTIVQASSKTGFSRLRCKSMCFTLAWMSYTDRSEDVRPQFSCLTMSSRIGNATEAPLPRGPTWHARRVLLWARGGRAPLTSSSAAAAAATRGRCHYFGGQRVGCFCRHPQTKKNGKGKRYRETEGQKDQQTSSFLRQTELVE